MSLGISMVYNTVNSSNVRNETSRLFFNHSGMFCQEFSQNSFSHVLINNIQSLIEEALSSLSFINQISNPLNNYFHNNE